MLTLVQTATTAAATEGKRIVASRYRVERTIAERTSGAAMEAYDLVTKQSVFLKTFLPEYLPQYRREAAAAMQLSHPNLLRAIDTASSDADGVAWIAYPFVTGASVREYVDRHEVSIATVLKCAAEVLKTLVYIHQQGWIHCDIKPDNLIRVDAVDGERFVLVDLGAATTVREARGGKHIVGSPAYTAPERLYDAFDAQSDLYSVGVLCYELATGHLPFIGTIKEIYQGHLSGQPAFDEVEDDDLRLLVVSLMEKQPSRRMRSAADALAAVLAISNNVAIERPNAQTGVQQGLRAPRQRSALSALASIGEFSRGGRPRALAVAANRSILALVFEAHAEFVDFSGRALGPAVICSGPLLADESGCFAVQVGGSLAQLDVQAGNSTLIASAVTNVRALCQRGKMWAWCDDRDVTALGPLSQTVGFRNRTYAGEPQLAFLDDDRLAVSVGSANHAIAYYSFAKGRLEPKIADFAGPIAAITESDSQLLCVSLMPHRPGVYEISAINTNGQRRSTEVFVANGVITAVGGRIFWLNNNGAIVTTDVGLALRTLGRASGDVRHLSVSPDARYLALLASSESKSRIQIMEIS